jgi:hypothetical protein
MTVPLAYPARGADAASLPRVICVARTAAPWARG